MKLMSLAKFSVVIATVFIFLAIGARRAEAETYAVIVGVKDYMHIGNLNFTKSDAYNFRDALIRIGVRRENIHLLTCPPKPGEPLVESKDLATKDNIEGTITHVLSLAKEGDTVIIFLGGHGIQLNGQPYFEPINSRDRSRAPIPASMVSIGKIFTDLGQCKATHKLMIVDACRDDEKTVGVEPLKPLSLTTEGITLFQGSGSGESCWELKFEQNGKEYGYGIFTNALIEGMNKARQDASKNIRLFSWVAYATEKTKQDAAKLGKKQTPHLQGNMTDFVIVPRGKVDPPPQEEIEKARARVKKWVQERTNTVLAKIAQDNQNPDLNPFNDTRLAGAIEEIIVKALEFDEDFWKAGYGLSDDGLYVLTQELIVDPVKDAIVAAREEWNEEKVEKDKAIADQIEKDKEAAIAAAAVEQEAREKAVADLHKFLAALPGNQNRDALYAALKDRNIAARKDASGNYEFRFSHNGEDHWLGKSDLSVADYGKMNSIGASLAYGLEPELIKKAMAMDGYAAEALRDNYNTNRSVFEGVAKQVHWILFDGNPDNAEAPFGSEKFRNLVDFLVDNVGSLTKRSNNTKAAWEDSTKGSRDNIHVNTRANMPLIVRGSDGEYRYTFTAGAQQRTNLYRTGLLKTSYWNSK